MILKHTDSQIRGMWEDCLRRWQAGEMTQARFESERGKIVRVWDANLELRRHGILTEPNALDLASKTIRDAMSFGGCWVETSQYEGSKDSDRLARFWMVQAVYADVFTNYSHARWKRAIEAADDALRRTPEAKAQTRRFMQWMVVHEDAPAGLSPRDEAKWEVGAVKWPVDSWVWDGPA